jgi:hypothetical protein
MYPIRAIKAASNISAFVTLPESLIKHTHFLVCAITLSSIIHLSLWSSVPVMAPDEDLRQQIRLNAGALKAVAPILPSAAMGFQQVSKAAQKIYSNRKDAICQFFWRDFVEDDFVELWD